MKIDVQNLRALTETTVKHLLGSVDMSKLKRKPCFLFFEPGGPWVPMRNKLNNEFPDDAVMLAVVSEETAKSFLEGHLNNFEFHNTQFDGYRVYCLYSDETTLYADFCEIIPVPTAENIN